MRMELWLWLAAWAHGRALTLAIERGDIDTVQRIGAASKAMLP